MTDKALHGMVTRPRGISGIRAGALVFVSNSKASALGFDMGQTPNPCPHERERGAVGLWGGARPAATFSRRRGR